MKQLKLTVLIAVAISTMFVSCKKEENETAVNEWEIKGKVAFVVNYGSYGKSNGEISVYSIDNTNIRNNFYKGVNGVAFNSNIQYFANNNGKAYFMSNSADKIDMLNFPTLKVNTNPISSNIVKPRYAVIDGTTAYISCFGNADWSVMADSYIAKIDLANNTVTKYSMPGGPEGLAISNGKLYAALNFRDSIAIMNLSNNQISYVNAPAKSSYFLKDNSNNLYVSLVSGNASGLGYFNTSTDVFENNYPLFGISSSYGSIMQFNKDKSKVYVIAATWVEENGVWSQKGAVKAFNITSKTFENTFLENITGINGIAVNPDNDDIYVLISPNATSNGTLKIYSSTGTLKDTEETGVAPQQVIFYNAN